MPHTGLVAVSVRFLSVTVHGLPIAAGLLWSTGLGVQASVIVAHGLSCPVVCGIFLGPVIKPMSSALAGRFLTTQPSKFLPTAKIIILKAAYKLLSIKKQVKTWRYREE